MWSTRSRSNGAEFSRSKKAAREGSDCKYEWGKKPLLAWQPKADAASRNEHLVNWNKSKNVMVHFGKLLEDMIQLDPCAEPIFINFIDKFNSTIEKYIYIYKDWL